MNKSYYIFLVRTMGGGGSTFAKRLSTWLPGQDSKPPTAASRTLFVCGHGGILSWCGAVCRYEEQKDVYNRGIT